MTPLTTDELIDPLVTELVAASVGCAALVLGIPILLVYIAIVLRRYVKIMMDVMDYHFPFPENASNDDRRTEGEAVRFRAADGHPLEGIILSGAVEQPRRGMIVFGHEFGSVGASGLRYGRALLEAGYDVFAFDFRGHGASPPEDGYRPHLWPSDREQADMIGAIEFIGAWLEDHDRPRDIGLFGVSRGGCAAILAAAEAGHVRAVATDGAFSADWTTEYLMKRFATIFARIRVVAEHHPPTTWRFLRWLLFRSCCRRFRCRFPSVRKTLARLGRLPILLIHGEKDSYIPVEHARELYALAEGPKSLWTVAGAKHNQSIKFEPDEYGRRLVEFFGRYLTPSTEEAGAARRRAAACASETVAKRATAPAEGRAKVPVERYLEP